MNCVKKTAGNSSGRIKITTIDKHKNFEKEISALKKQLRDLKAENSDLKNNIFYLNKQHQIELNTQKLAKVGGWEYDVKTETMTWSEETYRIHGLKENEIVQGSLEHIRRSITCYDEKDRPVIRKAFDECLLNGKAFDMEFPFTTYSGQKKWVRTIGEPVTNNGDIVKVFGNIMDITDRKLDKLKLEESENKYRELFEKSKDAILIIENGIFVDCNQATVEMLEYQTKEELLQTHPSELSPEFQPDGRLSAEKADEMMKIAIQNGSNRFEWNHVRSDGTVFPVEVLLTPVTKEAGKQIIHTVWRDISDRKKSEQKIQESHELFSRLISAIPDLIIRTDMSGTIIYVSEAGLKDWGYTRDDLLGQKMYSFVADETKEKALKNTQLMLQKRLGPQEYLLVMKSGEKVLFEVNGDVLRDENGEAIGIVHVCRDISERKEAEIALRESEEKFRELAELLPEIIYESDINGKLTFVNKQSYISFGYTEAEFKKGIYVLDTLVPEDRKRAKENIGKLLRGESTGNQKYTALKKDGSTFPVTVYSNTIYKNNRPAGLRGIIVDMTSQRQLEEKLRQSQKMEAVGQLAGGVAHDFNNLLTIINGYCDLLLMREVPPKLKKPLDQIKMAGEKATRLTSQLLAFSRKQIIQPKIMDLNTLVTDQTKMLRRLLGENIEITVLLSPAIKNIKADPGQIEQSIMNIAINSRDAMPFGGKLTVETAVISVDQKELSRFAGLEAGEFVMLAISDTGVGMDEATKNRIFEPFFTTKERDKGTGLGLATVYGIVRQNNGFIRVQSEPNRGTTFQIFLPVAETTRPDEIKKEEKQTRLEGTETILLVEDDPGVRGVTESTLTSYGYQVITAENGEEGLRVYNNHPRKIDLLLTDVIMPLMGGKELALKLRSKNPELKVVFFSGYTDDHIAHHGVLEEGVEFIQKPYTHAILAKKIRAILDK